MSRKSEQTPETEADRIARMRAAQTRVSRFEYMLHTAPESNWAEATVRENEQLTDRVEALESKILRIARMVES